MPRLRRTVPFARAQTTPLATDLRRDLLSGAGPRAHVGPRARAAGVGPRARAAGVRRALTRSSAAR